MATDQHCEFVGHGWWDFPSTTAIVRREVDPRTDGQTIQLGLELVDHFSENDRSVEATEAPPRRPVGRNPPGVPGHYLWT